ncbi:MAG: LysM peptidoglycan-binding domain-containing protein, partial [Bacteroidales bacterium]|nr:LysM peptidoglycan-binding domain-containing protein [Bacteroidales bacterium]
MEAKETFYGLSKLYGVSIDDIQMSNDNLRSLSIGQQIKIPVVAETAAESQYKDGELIVKNGQS